MLRTNAFNYILGAENKCDMKKALLVITCFVSVFLIFCNPARKAAKVTVPDVTYVADVQPIIATRCTPCHIPPKGNKKPYDSYVRVKDDIDSIISRINRNPGEKGFMPFKSPHKLPDSVLQVFNNWKATGMKEK
jgi:hypothetical protein